MNEVLGKNGVEVLKEKANFTALGKDFIMKSKTH